MFCMEDYRRAQRKKWEESKSLNSLEKLEHKRKQETENENEINFSNMSDPDIDIASDEELARFLEKDFVSEIHGKLDSLELIDPIPDVYVLFVYFNELCFGNYLERVEVKWSKRMTLCAGLCCYDRKGAFCTIKLSEPLLKFRSRTDLIETLLHEMIHAYLFFNNHIRDHDAHGPQFLKHMERINISIGTHISVYHNFNEEVNFYRIHWWKCQGKCGFVLKRSMNRAPSPNDPWWTKHQITCGGNFIKIKGPELNDEEERAGHHKKSRKTKEVIRSFSNGQLRTLDDFQIIDPLNPILVNEESKGKIIEERKQEALEDEDEIEEPLIIRRKQIIPK